MITTTIALLPLLVLGGATIDGASAELSAGKLAVTVTTSEAVDARKIHGKIAGGKLHLYLEGGHVHSDRRQFGEGGQTIVALPRADYAKLEVPLAAGMTCGGPIGIEGTDSGFRALVGCQKIET